MEPEGSADEIAELQAQLKMLQEEEDAIDAMGKMDMELERVNEDLKLRQIEGHHRLFGVDVCIALGALNGAEKNMALPQLMAAVGFASEFHPDALPRIALLNAGNGEMILDFDQDSSCIEQIQKKLPALFEEASQQKQTQAPQFLSFLQAAPNLSWKSATRVLFHVTNDVSDVPMVENSVANALAELEAQKVSYWLCSPSKASASVQRLRDIIKRNIHKGYSCGTPTLQKDASNIGACLQLAVQTAMKGCRSFKS